MKTKTMAAACCTLMGLLLLAGACSLIGTGQRPVPRLYVLSSLAASDPPMDPAAKLPRLSVGIGPVRLAEYLDRRNIIVRNSHYGIELVDLSQWAEPLSTGLARAMADNLSVLLGTHRMLHFPWPSTAPVDYHVTFQVTQFDGRRGEQVVLRAHWQVFAGDGRNQLESGHAVIREKVAGPSVEALVAAHSQAAAGLSREVAAAIANLAR